MRIMLPGNRCPSLLTSGAAAVDLSIVVPAYNEAVRLPPMLHAVFAYLERRARRSVPRRRPFTYEVRGPIAAATHAPSHAPRPSRWPADAGAAAP